MILEKVKLAVFNRKTEVTGSIYQMGIASLKSNLDKIIDRGFIGGVAFDQYTLYKGPESKYIVPLGDTAGKLLKYEIVTERDGGVIIYGTVKLSERCAEYRGMFPDFMDFSINATATQTVNEGVRFVSVIDLLGFDFVMVKEC